jgi:GNAT superfamily N-acetyltransferase
MKTRIIHNPKDVTYPELSQLNDLCFENEPISKNQYLSMRDADLWSVHDGRNLVGYSWLSISDKARIKRIAVAPGYRSRGIGSRLMERMIQKAQDSDARAVTLSVQQDNPAAIALYKKYGFQVRGESRQFQVDVDQFGLAWTSCVPVSDYGGILPPDIARWRPSHNPPLTYILLFTRDTTIVGFARFSPEFPGCSPFEVYDDEADIAAILSSIREYALAGKKKIKITTGNNLAIDLLSQAKYRENYCLFEMTREI